VVILKRFLFLSLMTLILLYCVGCTTEDPNAKQSSCTVILQPYVSNDGDKVPETDNTIETTNGENPMTTVTTSVVITTNINTYETTKIPIVSNPTISSRDKFISIVKNEIGVTEKRYNNIKYNTWYYGRPVKAPSDSSTAYAWCAVFVSWCADQADIPQSVIPKTASSRYYATWFNNQGRYTKYKSSYTPKVGDLIFIDWDKKRGGINTIDHVGVVISVEDGKVITVEGNFSNKVSCNTYSINDRSITGYATPAYK
jgi:hypothetical protein